MNAAIQPTSERYRFSNYADTGQTLDIFNEIDDWWGFGVHTLAYELSKLNSANPLTVRIHSPGGSVTEGIAIRNLLRAYPGELTTVGVGFVASIASVILLAGKRVKMSDNAYLMIHRPYGGVMGNADEMRQTADVLSSMDENILDMYMDAITSRGKEGTTREEVFEMMKKETWMTAREALDMGFIDEVVGADQLPVAASSFKALAKYQNTPQAIFSTQTNNDMTLIEQIKALLAPEPAAETVAPVAEAETTTEVQAPEVDPIEAARLLLEQQGFTVAKPETAKQDDEAVAAAFAQLTAEIKALRVQAAQAKATPSGGAVTAQPTVPKASQRDKAFEGFAQFTKQKIQTR